MNMRAFFVCVSILLALSVCAVDKTWTGGAGDSLFSSSSNWSPAGAPADGDALLFANSVAVNATNDLIGRAFSGITASGSGAVTLAAGNAFTLTGTLTVSGSGVLNTTVPFSITNAVTFNLSNANFYAYGAISGTGSITIEGGKDFYAKDAVSVSGGVTANKGRIRIEKPSFTAPVTLNQLRTNSVSYVALYFQNSGTYNVPITITNSDGSDYTLQTGSSTVHVTNTAPITLAPSTYTRWMPNGSITHAGGIIVQPPARGDMAVIFNGNNIIRDVPIAFTNNLFIDSGTLRLAIASNTYAYLKCYSHTVFTDVPYALDPNRIVGFGTSYKKYGTLDINGNNQIIDRPTIDNTAAPETSDYILTSSSGPATLTCRASGKSDFLGRLDGALSLCWDPVSSAHVFTITGRTSLTTGTLQVKAGTLLIASGTNTFPNLSGLVASGTGTLRVENAALSAAVTLTVTNTAQLMLPNGIALSCRNAQVDGTMLTAGVYSATSTVNGRAFITGSGTLTVLTIPLSGTVRTWTGAGTNILFSTAENWDAAPSFDGSETFQFAEAGTNALVDGTFRLGAIRYNRSTPFSLAPADESASMRLGLGGITVLTPAAGTPVSHTNAVPLALSFAHEWQIGSNQTLAITAPVSGGTPTAPFIKTGDGTLRLTGTNTFESPLVLSNGMVMVNNGTALGNPTNTITIYRQTSDAAPAVNQRGPLYFTDMVATNNRPLIFSSVIYYIGQMNPKNGTLVLNGKVTFLGGERIDNQSFMVFRGGFECTVADPWMQTMPGYMMRFEERPINMGSRFLPADNGGTFFVSTTNNTWGALGLYSATFLCGASNVIPTNSYITFGQSWTQNGFVDLNGFDQQLKFLNNNTGSTPSTNMAVRSATPATLTLHGDSAVRTFVGYFTNAVSLRHRNTGTLALTSRTSASYTKGDLLIEAGTVAFRSGATWTGSTNITVTAGTLSVEGGTGTTFGGNDPARNVTRLHLTSASHVNLATGITEYVRSATLDGENLPAGTYGSLTSSAQYKSALFTGTGILYVLRSEINGTLIRVL